MRSCKTEYDIVLVLPSLKGIMDSNLGLASIESYLKLNGIRCITIKGTELDDYIDKSEVFGISVLDHTHPNARKLTKKLKDKIVIWGGWTATTLPEYLLNENPDLDYIIMHEGEDRLLNLLKSFDDERIFDELDGIAYRDIKGDVVIRKAEKFVDMNSLPIPTDLALLGDFVIIDMTRGCYGRCRYCQEIYKMRFKSAENTIRDIRYWYERGYRKFYIGNANSMANGELMDQLIDEVEAADFQLEFGIVGRPNDYVNNYSTLERLFRSQNINIHILEIGVESNSENGLRLLGRNIQPETNRKIMKALIELRRKYSPGTNIMANMILFPHFDMEIEDFVENVKFIGDYMCSRNSMTPRVIGLANSSIWKEMNERGFKPVDDGGMRIVEYPFSNADVDSLYRRLLDEINTSMKKDKINYDPMEFMYRCHDRIMDFYKTENIEESVRMYIS